MKTLKCTSGLLQWPNLIRNHANSCCSVAAFPPRLCYSSPTSPTALNDVMGSAAQRDERDKAEPAGTGESFQHTIHNTAWELKSYRSSHSTPSISEPCAFSQHKRRTGGESWWSISNKRTRALKGRVWEARLPAGKGALFPLQSSAFDVRQLITDQITGIWSQCSSAFDLHG